MNFSQPIPHATQLPVPVPLPVRYTNCYTIDAEDGVVIVDAGMDTPDARDTWSQFIGHTGLDKRRVLGLFVTHFHPDHLGLAHWLSERVEAPVIMMHGEAQYIEKLRALRSDAGIRTFYGQHGVPDVIIDHWIALDRAFQEAVTLPSTVKTVHDHETWSLGNTTLEFLEQGGHTAHQGLVHLHEANALLTGDQVLARITPNVSLWPDGVANPLADYVSSLRDLTQLSHPLGLPAHEAAIPDVNQRVQELLTHHDQRNLKVMGFLQEGPALAYNLTRRLFQRPLDDYQLRFAVGETLAHMEFLKSEGRIGTFRRGDLLMYEKV